MDEHNIDINLDATRLRAWMKQADLISGQGDSKKSLANVMCGFNHRMANSIAPKNVANKGMVFFTRPDMRLDTRNASKGFILPTLFEAGVTGTGASIIAALDPLNAELFANKGTPRLGGPLREGVMFDNRQAFIPLLSNRLISLTGWPDSTMDKFTSDEGIKREQWSMADGTHEINNAFDLSSSFMNMAGDPLTAMFSVWLEYMGYVYEGTYLPRAINNLLTRIDYQTRIYRLVLDPSRRYVVAIGMANACFPTNDNMGAIMNLVNDSPMTADDDQLSISWSCTIAQYRRRSIVEAFNSTVCMFNPDMLPQDGWKPGQPFVPLGHHSLVKLSDNEKTMFNYHGYPRIDPVTRELEWWIGKDDYYSMLESLPTR